MTRNRSAYVWIMMLVTWMVTVGSACAAGNEDTVKSINGLLGSVSGPVGIATVRFSNLSSTGSRYLTNAKTNTIVAVDKTDTLKALPSLSLNNPGGIAVDSKGNVYIADTLNHRVLKIAADTYGRITPASVVSTIAGNGIEGFNGDGAATSYSLNRPTAVAFDDASGNLYIADNGNYRIRMVTKTGNMTTIAGDGTATTLAASGVAVSPKNGDLYIADAGNHRILKMVGGSGKPVVAAGTGIAGYDGDGGLGTKAHLNQPSAVTTDGFYVYIADTQNNCIRKLAIDTGVISTRAGIPNAANLIYPAIDTTATPLVLPTGIALDAAGDLYVASTGNDFVYEIFAPISAITTASPPGGSYIANSSTTLSVTLTPNKPATIYYTTDGTPPTTSSNKYFDTPIPITANTKLRFYSVDVFNNPETINFAYYTLDKIAPVTTASPVGGTFYLAPSALMSITLTPSDPDAVNTTASDPMLTVYYSLDGKLPTTASTKYTGPILLPVPTAATTTTVQYFAVDEKSGNKEQVKSQQYVISALATTPSLPGGTYSAKTVTLTANDPTATIYATTTGADPTLADLYPGPITLPVNATTTLKYFAKNASGSETIKTQVYVIDTIAPTSAASPPGGTFASSQVVTLTANDPTATIYYTTTGSTPTSSSTKYVAPITISKTTTLMFFAMDIAGNKEAVNTQVYTIDTIAPTTTASIQAGAYASAQTVTLTADDSKATIYYTIDGTPPTAASTKYSAPIVIGVTTTLMYFAIDSVGNKEAIKTQVYVIDTIAPTSAALPLGGTFTSSPVVVTLTANDPTATIYYTTTGSTPTSSSPKYSTPITISKTTTLMFFAMDAAGNKEAVNSQVYTIDATAPTTTASILSGTYASVQTVALTADDSKATIYYTTDGSTPTTTSTKYITPLVISTTTTLKYFAMDVVGNKEAVKTQDYVIITLLTTASPNGGMFNAPQTVALATNGAGATIYYTIDKTTPQKGGKTTLTYTAPIVIQNNTTLQFYAIDGKGVAESVKAEIYTVDTTAPVTTVKCGTATNTINLTAKDNADPFPKIMYSVNDPVTHNGSAFAYFTKDITFTNNTIIKAFAVDAAGNTEKMQTVYCPVVVAPLDANPALYLETLADSTTTSNSYLFVTGTVWPVATASSLLINGLAPTLPTTADGSFTFSTAMPLAGNLTITNGATPLDSRTINAGATATTDLAIGKSNGVVGNKVRIPVTLTSGYQAAAVGIHLTYDNTKLTNPIVEIASTAAALGKSIQGASPSAGNYTVLIMDTTPPATGTTHLTPLPDGIVAYLTFTIVGTATPGTAALTITSYEATDLDANKLTPNAGTAGLVNVVSKPGNSIGVLAGDIPVTLQGVQDALYMLLDPATYPVDGSVDLNADGVVEIWELQKVFNNYIGL